jgi:uncharacterized membrane protein YgcG
MTSLIAGDAARHQQRGTTWAGNFDCSACRRKRLVGAEFSKTQLEKYRKDTTFLLKCKACCREAQEAERKEAAASNAGGAGRGGGGLSGGSSGGSSGGPGAAEAHACSTCGEDLRVEPCQYIAHRLRGAV